VAPLLAAQVSFACELPAAAESSAGGDGTEAADDAAVDPPVVEPAPEELLFAELLSADVPSAELSNLQPPNSVRLAASTRAAGASRSERGHNFPTTSLPINNL
jgi:hypothetical protein